MPTLPILPENPSKAYPTGKILVNNQGDLAEIKGISSIYKVLKNGTKAYRYVILSFTDRTEIVVDKSNVKTGNYRNPCKPSVYGRGYYGIGPHLAKVNGKSTREYNLWHDMLRRCYDNTKRTHKNKSYIDCTVHSSWWNFQTFCKDIQHLEGYTEWAQCTTVRGYHLDKDTKVKGNRKYSKDTCLFLSQYNNLCEVALTGLTYLGFNVSTRYHEEFVNIKKFCVKYKLDKNCVRSCIKGIQKSHKEWTFEIKKEKGERNGRSKKER